MFRTVLALTLALFATAASADVFVKLEGVTIHTDRAKIHDAAVKYFDCKYPEYTLHYGSVAADPNALLANQDALLAGRRTNEESIRIMEMLQRDTSEFIWVALSKKRSSQDCFKK